MKIIPVIDLLDGQVVHARRGERTGYQPLCSSLCEGSAPLLVARALLELYPFPTLYIADLDAIQGRGNNWLTLLKLRTAFPRTTLWLDSGVEHPQACGTVRRAGFCCVIGSEKLGSLAQFTGLVAATPDCVLSLDFGPSGLLGPADLLTTPGTWPRHLIAMTLPRVGSGEGPDMATLAMLQQQAQGRHVYAAGGVRHTEDLARLMAQSVEGVLVASALHDGTLGRAALTAIQ